MKTTRHGGVIGAALGNREPDTTSLPGILRGPDVLLQFGDLETQFGIRAEPLAVFERERGHSRIVTTFTHEADAERYLLTVARPEIIPQPWDAARGRYAWPDDVDVDVAELNVAWENASDEHGRCFPAEDPLPGCLSADCVDSGTAGTGRSDLGG